MTLSAVEITGYRSIRKIRFPVRQLTVLVGGNGVGKTNLYRSLELLQAAARGTLADEIAREGGLGSIFWAGGKNLSPDGDFDPMYRTDGYRKGEGNSLRLAASFADLGDGSFDPTYRLEAGFPAKTDAAFPNEAQVKAESLEWQQRGKAVSLMDRKNGVAWARDAAGRRELANDDMLASETALAVLSGRSEIALVRDSLVAWRFFHGFRTDAESALRRPSRAVTAPWRMPFRVRNWSFPRLANLPASACAMPKCPSGCSRRTNFPTARCNSWPWRAPCSPIACHPSSPSTSRKTASIPICCRCWRG